MRVCQLVKPVLACLTFVSAFAPTTKLFGDELPGHVESPFAKVARERHDELHDTDQWKQLAPTISDVALDTDGNLHGTFVNQVGLPVAGTLVSARQGSGRIHTANTDANGAFTIAGLKGGIWSITAGVQTSWVRTWNANTAPPASKAKFLMVKQSTVVRGQSGDSGLLSAFYSGTLFSIGTGLAGITLGVIGISEASQANDEADSAQASAAMANDEAAALRDQLNALSTTVNDQTTQLNALQMQVDDLAATLN